MAKIVAIRAPVPPEARDAVLAMIQDRYRYIRTGPGPGSTTVVHEGETVWTDRILRLEEDMESARFEADFSDDPSGRFASDVIARLARAGIPVSAIRVGHVGGDPPHTAEEVLAAREAGR